MWELFAGFALSAVLALVLTPIVRGLAHRWKLLDHPDGGRKIHARATPVAGGLAIVASLLITVSLLLAFAPWLGSELSRKWDFLLSLGSAWVLICLLGVVDDYGLLRGRYKLLGQTVIVMLIIAQGLRVDQFQVFGYTVELGWLAVPFTVFWLLGAINSLNLLDGMDGFLTSIAIVATLGFASMACLNGAWTTACIAFVLAGALLGFLRYNFPPASIFLGDSGSMLIGLTIGVLAIRSSMKASAMVSLAAPLAILTLPILDTFAAIIRRKLTGRSIYATDRGHLHHCMANRGLSNRNVLALVAVLSTVTVLGAIGSIYLRNETLAIGSVLTVTGILVASRVFGYMELVLLKKSLTHKTMKLFGSKKSAPKVMAVQLQGKANWAGLWRRLELAAQELNLHRVTLDVNAAAFHEGYHARWESGANNTEQKASWSVTIPLSLHGNLVGRLEVEGQRQAELFWETLSKVAMLVEDFELQLALSLPAVTPPKSPPLSKPELAISA